MMCQRLCLVLGIWGWMRRGSCPQEFALGTAWNQRGNGETEKSHKSKCHEAVSSIRYKGREQLVLPGRASWPLKQRAGPKRKNRILRGPIKAKGGLGFIICTESLAPKYVESLKKVSYCEHLLICTNIEPLWCTLETNSVRCLLYLNLKKGTCCVECHSKR